MPSTPLATTALVRTDQKVDPAIIAKYTHANKIEYKSADNDHWLYVIHCKKPKEYDAWSEALTAVEVHMKKIRCFKPVLDDGDSTSGKISLNPQFEDGFNPANVWKSTRPNNGRKPSNGLDRLNKQLEVDFAIEVHGAEGKRKREPIQTIYDEATSGEEEKKRSTETDEKKRTKPRSSPPATRAAVPPFADKALDAVIKSHAEVIAAKEETIKALTAALVAKEELIQTQAAMLATRQIQ